MTSWKLRYGSAWMILPFYFLSGRHLCCASHASHAKELVHGHAYGCEGKNLLLNSGLYAVQGLA